MKNRRVFLKTACKPLLFASLGIPLIESCSTDNDDSQNSSLSTNSNSNQTVSSELEINLDDSRFSSLKEIGGWLNHTPQNILMVRVSDDEIRVFDNSCPHQGTRNMWSFDGSRFTCGNHGNSYSASCSGSLKCYDVSINENILTITIN